MKKDLKQAAEWYQKSAEQGYVEAQVSLGACYEDGEGVEKDIDKAVEWYTLAANQGNEAAQEALKELGVE